MIHEQPLSSSMHAPCSDIVTGPYREDSLFVVIRAIRANAAFSCGLICLQENTWVSGTSNRYPGTSAPRDGTRSARPGTRHMGRSYHCVELSLAAMSPNIHTADMYIHFRAQSEN